MTVQPLRISTLNARSIHKTQNTLTQQMYTKFLRSKIHNPCHILCLQDVYPCRDPHLSASHTQSLERLFPQTTTFFTKFTAIIIFNQAYTMDNASITPDQRILTANIIDTSTNTTICSIASIYAPAQRSARPAFYKQLQEHPLINYKLYKWIMMGDFTFTYTAPANYHHTFSHGPTGFINTS
ncbi:unnamed protein product [Absidia cylindrospora]